MGRGKNSKNKTVGAKAVDAADILKRQLERPGVTDEQKKEITEALDEIDDIEDSGDLLGETPKEVTEEGDQESDEVVLGPDNASDLPDAGVDDLGESGIPESSEETDIVQGNENGTSAAELGEAQSYEPPASESLPPSGSMEEGAKPVQDVAQSERLVGYHPVTGEPVTE